MGVKVRKRDCKWYVVIDYHGRRKSKCVGTREAAEKVRREVEARLALGTFDLGDKATPTFAEYSVGKSYIWDITAFAVLQGKTTKEAKQAFREQKPTGWMKEYAEQNLKPSTADFYLEFLCRYVLPVFGRYRIDEILRSAVKDWIADLGGRGLSRNTIRLAVSTLRVVLNGAIEDNHLKSNPAARLGRFVKSHKPDRESSALTPEEAKRLLEGAKESCPQHYPLFLTALRAGLREGELIGLRWGDIQFGADELDPNRFILVVRNYDRRSRKFLTPKNGKVRRVDLSCELRKALMELRDQRLLEAFGRGQLTIADDPVFQSAAGTVLDIRGNVVQRHFVPLLESAGLRRIRFHDLRQHADSRIMPNVFQIHRLAGLGPCFDSA